MSLWIAFGILLVALLVLRNKLTSEPGLDRYAADRLADH